MAVKDEKKKDDTKRQPLEPWQIQIDQFNRLFGQVFGEQPKKGDDK